MTQVLGNLELQGIGAEARPLRGGGIPEDALVGGYYRG